MYGDKFDYEPQSEEALAAARAPLPAPPPMYRALDESVDDGMSTQPTQQDVIDAETRRLQEQGANAAIDNHFVDAEVEAENDRVAGLVALKQQQAAMGIDPGQEPAEVYAQQLSQRGQQQFADSLGMLQQKVRSTQNNPAYQSTKNYLGAMQGGGTEQQTDPFGRPMSDAAGNPIMHRDPGLVAEQREATRQSHVAEMSQARMSTQFLQQEADMQAQLGEQMRAQELQRQQRVEAQRQAVDNAYQSVQKANQELQDSDEIDPDKGWGEKGVGSKILAILASGLLGFSGMDPMSHINSVIQNSIDAQKANQDRKRARVSSAQGVQAASENLLGQLRSQLGDEATADEAYRLTMLGNIRAQAVAKLSDAGVTVLQKHQQELLNGIDQQMAETRRRLELTAATNVKTFTSYSPKYTGAAASLIKDRGKAGIGMESEGLKGAVGTIQDRQKQNRDLGSKAAADAASNDFRERELAVKQQRNEQGAAKTNSENRRMIAKETAVPNRIRQLAGDLLADIEANNGDVPGVGSVYIPGVGAPTHSLTREARDFKRRLQALGEYDITDLTGAVSSEEQQKVISAFLSGDETAIQSGLLEIQRAMDTYVNTIEGADPQAAEAIRQHTRKGEAGYRGARADAPIGASEFVDEDTDDE